MYAAFLIEIQSSCRGITGDATIATVLKKTGLALPGGKCDYDESPKRSLEKIIEQETKHTVKDLKLVYEGPVHDNKIGGFTANILNTSTLFDFSSIKYETINNLLVSQSDLQIRRWLVEAIISCGLHPSDLSKEAWIACFGSGTLQYSIAAGNSVKSVNLYWEERCAFELYGAECIASSRIASGPPIAEGDCRKWTEALWRVRQLRAMDALIMKIGPIAPQYITISEENKNRWEGLGIVLNITQRNISWWPNGYSAVIKF